MAVALKACIEALEKFHNALVLGGLSETDFRTGITEATGTSKTSFEVIGNTLKDHENKIQDMTTAVNNQVGALTVGMTGIQQQMQSMAGIQQQMQTVSNEWNTMKQQTS